MEKIGYLYEIDLNDFNFTYLFKEDKITPKDIREYIITNYNDFGASSSYNLFEVYLVDFKLKDFDNIRTLKEIIDGFPYRNEIKKIDDEKLLNNTLIKFIKRETLKMPLTDFNSLEHLMQKWDENCDIFIWDGNQASIDENRLEKIKEYIKLIEKEIKKNQ